MLLGIDYVTAHDFIHVITTITKNIAIFNVHHGNKQSKDKHEGNLTFFKWCQQDVANAKSHRKCTNTFS